jgi:hypothetical protein
MIKHLLVGSYSPGRHGKFWPCKGQQSSTPLATGPVICHPFLDFYMGQMSWQPPQPPATCQSHNLAQWAGAGATVSSVTTELGKWVASSSNISPQIAYNLSERATRDPNLISGYLERVLCNQADMSRLSCRKSSMLLFRPSLPPSCISAEPLYRVPSFEESFLSSTYYRAVKIFKNFMFSGSSELKVNMFIVTHFFIWDWYRRWNYLVHTFEHEPWYSTWCGWQWTKTFTWTLFTIGYYRKLVI